MDIPRAPDDLELKNIIDKLANFVARNGPEFEQMTKQKQQDNPKFSFLFSGEYYNYYQYRVTTEQAVLKQQQDKMVQQQAIIQQAITQQSIRTAPWQQSAAPSVQDQLEQQRAVAMEQIQQSETNLAAQYQSIMQQQQTMIDDAIYAAKREQLVALGSECQMSLDELDAAVQPIIDSCTKEAISTGKNWIFVHNTSQRHGDLIAHYLLDRVSAKDASFELRLHLIYLINDILHHCLRRNADDLRKSVESVVVPLFCISQLAVDEERQNKLKKLLGLWASNNYFEPQVIESMKNPFNAMAAYQAGLMASHGAIVSQISQEMNNRYMALQKQHHEFAAHLNGQIAALEHQLMMQTASSSTSTAMSVPDSSAAVQQASNAMDGGSAGNMSTMSGSSVGFGPQGYGASAPHFSQPPPAFGPPPPPLPPPPPAAAAAAGPAQFDYSHGPGEYSGMPPVQSGPPGNIPLPLPDLSKPPPGFPPGPGFGPAGPPPQPPPLMSLPLKPPKDTELMPSMPYYDLPAGLMAPLVKLEDCDYTPLNPRDIRLPPPMPPTDRLLAAVEAFYSPPSHERPRDSEGWEKLGLFEFFKAKQKAKKMKDEMSRRRSKSRSASPRRRRRSSRRHSQSRSRSRSVSPSRRRRSSRSPSRSRSRSASRSRSRSRSKSREKSRTPPSFYSEPYYQSTTETRLGEENKGHQLLTKMGWGGGGLGHKEQGMMDPVQHAEVRDRTDLYKGIGIALDDPFENFRKNKSHGFVTRMREKAEASTGGASAADETTGD